MPTAKVKVRQQLIAMALRRQRPGTGSSIEFLRQRTARLQIPDLTTVLSGIPWAAVGAIAARSYMAERATLDFDIAIRPQDAAQVTRRLDRAGFTYKGTLSIGGSSWTAPDGSSVDVLELSQPWAEEALAAAQHNIRSPGIPVLPLSYLVLMKLEAGRIIDLGDATRMLGQASENELAAIRTLFHRYAQGDTDDLESLIALGRLELEPGHSGQ